MSLCLYPRLDGLLICGFVIEATPVDTLQNQFSGYGSNAKIVAKVLDELGLKEPLENWSEGTIERMVNKFVDVKFPTVIALNKIDHPDSDKNIAKISKMYPNTPLVLTSSISEVFLRRLAKQGYVKYVAGGDVVDTREDLIADGDPDGGGLKEMDEKLRNRLENLKDLVLYRFGSTGVVQVLTKAAEVLGLVPIFPVKNIGNFSDGGKAFRDCVLVKKGTTVGEVYRKVMGDAPLAYVEGVGGIRVSEDDEIMVGKNDVRLMHSNKDEILLSYGTDIVFQSWPRMTNTTTAHESLKFSRVPR